MARGAGGRTVGHMSASSHDQHAGALEPHGLRAITDYLDGEGVRFEVIEHAPTETAATEARAAHVPGDRMAKTVVVRAQNAWVIAVVPSSAPLDLEKLRRVLGIEEQMTLATEDEIAERFPRFDVGAVPPVGPMLTAATVVDARLLAHDEIVCPGGDHRHAVRLPPRDVVRLADAHVADITHDWSSAEPRVRF